MNATWTSTTPAAEPVAARSACCVCGCDEVDIDHVTDRETWMLAECTRCRHRWTSPVSDPPEPAARPAARLARARGRRRDEEVATAA